MLLLETEAGESGKPCSPYVDVGSCSTSDEVLATLLLETKTGDPGKPFSPDVDVGSCSIAVGD